ncbi:thiamine diphosphokinase [Calditrichota bacterium]
MTKSVLIIANGPPPQDKLLNKLVVDADIIIAADGGANTCYKKNINPDFIIGDLDSIKSDVKSHFSKAEIIYRPNQNKDDFYKTLTFCDTLNPEKVIATAVLGMRFDHSLSNLFSLQSGSFNFQIELYDDYGITAIIKKERMLNLQVGQTISLTSFLPVFGITLTGFKYLLNNKDFPQGFNGLSNEMTESPAQIRVKKGSLISYILHAND